MFILFTLVYMFFTYILYVQTNKSYSLHPPYLKKDNLDKYLWYFIIIFTLIGGFRWNIGADSYAYAKAFKYPNATIDLYLNNQEYLWYGLMWLHDKLGLHYVFGMCTSVFLQIYYLTKSTHGNRALLLYLPIVMFGSHFFHDMMNGVRQLIAAAIFMYATLSIVERKPIKYCILIILASLFHHSALILLPIYLLTYLKTGLIKLINNRQICIVIFISCIVLGNTPQFESYMSYFEKFARTSGYENYWSNLNEHLNKGLEETQVNLFGLMQLSYIITGIVTIFYAPKLYDRFKEQIPFLGLWLFCSFAYICFSYLFQNLGISLIRPIMYLEYFHMFIISLLLYYFKRSMHKPSLFKILVITIWVAQIWNIMKASPYYPSESVIYKMFLFHNIRPF